jgi:Pilus assembly protein, PilO
MNDLLRSPKAKVGAAVAGGLLIVLAAWLFLVSPERSKATDLGAEVKTTQAELTTRKRALVSPSAAVTVKPSDLYRLTKALPDETDMSGILLDVNRLAARNKLTFKSITPAATSTGTGYRIQPLAVIVQGRFTSISRFLGDIRTLVSVKGKRLDARGRLYSVSAVNITAPDSPNGFPTVKAAVTLNAYSFSAPTPTTTTPDPSTTTDTSSSGTVAAGATP